MWTSLEDVYIITLMNYLNRAKWYNLWRKSRRRYIRFLFFSSHDWSLDIFKVVCFYFFLFWSAEGSIYRILNISCYAVCGCCVCRLWDLDEFWSFQVLVKPCFCLLTPKEKKKKDFYRMIVNLPKRFFHKYSFFIFITHILCQQADSFCLYLFVLLFCDESHGVRSIVTTSWWKKLIC